MVAHSKVAIQARLAMLLPIAFIQERISEHWAMQEL